MAWPALFSADGLPLPLGALPYVALLQCLELNDQARAAQVVAAAGGGVLTAWHYQPSTWPPSWAAWTVGDDVHLIFAGTSNATQWAGHLGGVFGTAYTGFPGVVAHAMFLAAWQVGLSAAVLAVIGPLPGKRVRLCGHSYGGGVAMFAALELAQLGTAAAVELITIGQPRGLSDSYAGPLPTRYARFAGPLDPVPRLPCDGALSVINPIAAIFSSNLSWRHYGQGWLVAPTVAGTFANVTTSQVEAVGVLGAAQISQHYVSTYYAALEAWSVRSNEDAATRAAISAALAGVPGVPDAQSDQVSIPPSSVTTPAAANQVYFRGQTVATTHNLDNGFRPVAFGASVAAITGPSILGGSTVAIWKVKITFQYQNNGWQELYWSESNLPTTPIFFNTDDINRLLGPRPPGTILVSAAAYAPFATEAGANITYAAVKPGTAVTPTTSADPAGVVAYCRISTETGKSRNLSIKCWEDGLVARNPDGTPLFSGAMRGKLADYEKFLRAAPGYGIAVQSKRNTLAGKRYKVLSIAQVSPGVANIVLSANDWTALTTNNTSGVVAFTGRDKITLVALKGFFNILAQTTPNVTIAYTLPAAASSFTPSRLQIHNVEYNFSAFAINTLKPVDWRTRKAGRPTGLSRGRGSKQISRT